MVAYCEHPFVIFSHGRCGSNFLVQQLNRHPAVRGYMEMLRDDVDGDHRGPEGEDPVAYLVRTVYARDADPAPVRGFKMFYFHRAPGERERVWDWLASLPSMRAVFLERRNLLALYLSSLRARQTNTWHPIGHRGRDAYLGRSVRLRVDPNEAIVAIRTAAETAAGARRYLDRCLPRPARLELSTEALAADPAGSIARVLRFIGAPDCPDLALGQYIGSGVRKGPLEIDNERELGAAMEYHGYAWMYEDLGFEVPYPGPARRLARGAAKLLRRSNGEA